MVSAVLASDVIIILKHLSQGPAKLPLEILLLVAGFVAGDNNYGTLLSFCLMSSRIREETKSVLYETIMPSEYQRLLDGVPTQQYFETCRYTRYVMSIKASMKLTFILTGSSTRGAPIP